jgi:hypothetical protein
MAQSIYSGWTSSQLWQQIRTRISLGSDKFGDITDKTSSDDMANALIADDERRATANSALPLGVITQGATKLPIFGVPAADKFIHGHARRDYGHHLVADRKDPKKKSLQKLDTGEIFAVCKHGPDGYGNEVSCMNQTHTWQGTEAQFRQFFSSVEYNAPTKTETTIPTSPTPKGETESEKLGTGGSSPYGAPGMPDAPETSLD